MDLMVSIITKSDPQNVKGYSSGQYENLYLENMYKNLMETMLLEC